MDSDEKASVNGGMAPRNRTANALPRIDEERSVRIMRWGTACLCNATNTFAGYVSCVVLLPVKPFLAPLVVST